jgi:GntR family transcriptional regulator / MocR family aminotransferase
VLTAAMAEHAPAVRVTGLAAGFHAVAHLPATANELHVAAAARERGVGLYPMAEFRSSPSQVAAPSLVMGFGNIGERAIEPGIAAIADLLAG